MASGRRAGSVASNQSTGSKSTRAAKSPAKPRASKAAKAKVEADDAAAANDEEPEEGEIRPEDVKPDADAIEAKAEEEQQQRPALPVQRNPSLPDQDVPVKLQIIRRDGK